jgi:hypothetical protein
VSRRPRIVRVAPRAPACNVAVCLTHLMRAGFRRSYNPPWTAA